MTLNKYLNQVRQLKNSLFTNLRIWSNSDIYNRVLSLENSNDLLAKLIENDQPAMVARMGSVELLCLSEYFSGGEYQKSMSAMSSTGFFPIDQKHLNRFSELFLEALKVIDILGIWFLDGEPKVIRDYCPTASLIKARGIEPYYHNEPWSKNLAGKKVLVVHPFAETIASQYKNRELIFKNQDILPLFELKTLKAVQSIAGTKTEFDTWFDAYDWMCNQIKQQDFDVAIIGCGAYGLPLAAYVKSIGKQAIHMGGATQVLFGIKGKRWDEVAFFQSLYNESWVRPKPEETVQNYYKVESGCYW